MSGSDPTNQANPSETQETAASPPETAPVAGGDTQAGDAAAEAARRRILIGSQRDPAAYRPRRRDWVPVEESDAEGAGEAASGGASAGKKHRGRRRPPRDKHHDRPAKPPIDVVISRTEPGRVGPETTGRHAPAQSSAHDVALPTASTRPEPVPAAEVLGATGVSPVSGEEHGQDAAVTQPPVDVVVSRPEPGRVGPETTGRHAPGQSSANDVALPSASTRAEPMPADEPHIDADEAPSAPLPGGKLPVPSVRDRFTPDMEAELDRAMGDAQLDDLLGSGGPADEGMLEPESQHRGRVVAIRRDDVFLELGGREQGIISLQHFAEPPQIGAVVEVVVQRFKADEGLYELAPPNTAMRVEDWGDLSEGMLVEARVTGHNTGGLECEVHHIRGFIPISQVALYRVEDLAPFVGQSFTCLVTEANPERRNLVLSRRAVLEREKQEAREQLIRSIQPGQIREGVVRKLLDFGAFVDVGGVDGLLHVSQLAWHRVNHPSEVLSEGQTIKVTIEKIDHDTGKMSLGYRDLFESPWAQAATKYPPNMQVKGKVTKLMEFGAFVALEPGVEGLVHISELSHKRVWRASDVVKEGDEVEVLVLSVDPQAQRISLSMKALAAPPEPTKKEKEEAAAAGAPVPSKRRGPERPLQGGLGRTKGGARYGLKW